MSYRNCIAILACLVISYSSGCSGDSGGPRTVPAKGVITLDGKTVEGAAIVFVGMDNFPYSAQAMSDSSGNFSLNAVENKTGAVPGEYMWIANKTVEITTANVELKGEAAEHAAEGDGGTELGVRNDLPQKYQAPKPDRTITIPDDGITDIKLELTSN